MISEPVMSMAQAAKAVPTRPNIATVWRWATRGCRGVILETMMIGGQRFTTEASLQKFFEEINHASKLGRPIKNTVRQASVNQACDAEGI